jgi:hypothetical protein
VKRVPQPTVSVTIARAGLKSWADALWAAFISPTKDPWLLALKSRIQDARSTVELALAKPGDPIRMSDGLGHASRLLSVLSQLPTFVRGPGLQAYRHVHRASCAAMPKGGRREVVVPVGELMAARESA